MTGDAGQVSPVVCRHEQTLIPQADRIAETLYVEGNRRFLEKHYRSERAATTFFES